jgi:hypothetical protein
MRKIAVKTERWNHSNQADLFGYSLDRDKHKPRAPGNVIAEQPILQSIVDRGRLQLETRRASDPVMDLVRSMACRRGIFTKTSKTRVGEQPERWQRRITNRLPEKLDGVGHGEPRRMHENDYRIYLAFKLLVAHGLALKELQLVKRFLQEKRDENKSTRLDETELLEFLRNFRIIGSPFFPRADKAILETAAKKISRVYNDSSDAYGNSDIWHEHSRKSGLLKMKRHNAKHDAHLEEIAKQG